MPMPDYLDAGRFKVQRNANFVGSDMQDVK